MKEQIASALTWSSTCRDRIRSTTPRKRREAQKTVMNSETLRQTTRYINGRNSCPIPKNKSLLINFGRLVGQHVDQQSAESWSTVGRQMADRRPTVDRLSTDCRPMRWPLFKLLRYEMRRWCVGGVLVTPLGLMELF